MYPSRQLFYFCLLGYLLGAAQWVEQRLAAHHRVMLARIGHLVFVGAALFADLELDVGFVDQIGFLFAVHLSLKCLIFVGLPRRPHAFIRQYSSSRRWQDRD